MAQAARRLRGLAYALADVESALRAAGRAQGAQQVGAVAGRLTGLMPDNAGESLDECREALQSVLLGERDLPVEIIGLILDTLAGIDDGLRNV